MDGKGLQVSRSMSQSALCNGLEQGPIPLYYQLEQRLRARISADEFVPGVALPTEDQICQEYKVSRITVRRALDALQRQGLIERRRGLGSFVLDRRHGINSQLTGSLEEFLVAAGSLRTVSLSLQLLDPPDDVKSRLELRHDETAVLLRTIGYLEKLPVAYLEIWLPGDVGAKLRQEDIDADVPVVRLVEQVANVRITRAVQIIEPGLAGETAASFLEIAPEAPILQVQRVYFAGDRPVELANVRYHPDRYRYTIELKG